jgi:CubicO group peptidase (beta-lactamase class C family)
MKNILFTTLFLIGTVFNNTLAQSKEDKQLTTAIDKLLSEQFKTDETGATALVARNGQIVYKKAFGMANLELNIPMQPDNVFRIGSITKQFTAVAILQLMEQGKLSLQDDITKFIPDYPTHGHKITIEHLLTHTSGIKSYTGMKDFGEIMRKDMKPEELINHFKNQPMDFAPGTKWMYNNSGYYLLGFIIEKVSGKTYPQYLEEFIFKPLGMTNSYYGSDSKIIKNRASAYSKTDKGFNNADPLSMTLPYSAGSIQSTVEDLFKWHQAVHTYKLVKKESLDKAFTAYKLSDGKATTYGYGWGLGNIQGSETIEHGGGINGFLTMSIYLPKEDVFVVVFSNCDDNSPNETTAKIAALTIGKPYEYKEIKLDNAVLESYTGVYQKEGSDELRVITFADNQLYSQRGKNTKFKVTPYQKDMFFFENVLTTLEFGRNDVGQVDKLIVKGRQGNETWTKTNKPIPTIVEIQVEDNILGKYVGDYELATNFILSITKEKNKLFAQATGQGKNELFAETETKFFLKVVPAQIEFFKDDTGKVTKLVLNQGGAKMEAPKTK